MAIKINAWKPDTCGCILHYSWDDSVAQEDIVTTFFAVEKVCKDHVGIVTQAQAKAQTKSLSAKADMKTHGLDVISQVLEENKQFNMNKFDQHVNKLSLVADEPVELVAPKSQAQIDRERSIVTQQLEEHSIQVQERYDAIFSSDFHDVKEVYDIVKAENDLKNKTLRELLKNNVDLRDDDGTLTLRKDLEYRWEWDVDRNLKISFVDSRTGTPSDMVFNMTNINEKVILS